jgi:hypothetical protein
MPANLRSRPLGALKFLRHEKWGRALMLSEEDAYAILRNIRLILLESFDLATVRRLRLLADQIEQKIQTPSVMLPKINMTDGPNGARPG